MEPEAGLRLRLFGGFELQRDGRIVEGLRTREADRLLAFLILANRPVRATAVATTFWPATGSPDSLRQSVRQLRKALGSDGERVESLDGLLAFRADGVQVDLLEFDRLGAHADAAALEQAASLYTGPLLKGWEKEWVTVHRTRRRDLYLDIQRRRAHIALACGDPAAAAAYLRECVETKPSEERSWRDLMSAQARAGERVAALATYERYRAYLHRHNGLAPPPETTALFQSLREGTATGLEPSAAPDAAQESVGGAVPLNSAFYVIRAADALFCPAIARLDSLVLVKGPRQSGKSSLLARGLQRARQGGALTAATDFETLALQDLETLDTLCFNLAAQLAAQLDLTEIDLKGLWQPLLGPGANLERFLIRHVLQALPGPLVWALDGVDRLFPLPYSGEFFSMLRAWHEKRALEPFRPWRRLTVTLACATEAHLFIRDLNKSPFNVGTRVEMADFTRAQVADLDGRSGGILKTDAALERFYALVGGHPYLVRRGLQEMAGGTSLATLLASAATEDGPFGDHLRRLARRLAEDPLLASAAKDALRGKPCPPDAFFRLRSAGVLAGELDEAIRPRCRLYADYLEPRL